jgi:hypothetical protein
MIHIACVEFGEKHGRAYARLIIRTDAKVQSHVFVPDGIEHAFPFIVDPLSLSVEEKRDALGSLPHTTHRDYDALVDAIKDAYAGTIPFGAVYALHGLLMTEAAKAYNTPAFEAVSKCELRLIEEVIQPRDLYNPLRGGTL